MSPAKFTGAMTGALGDLGDRALGFTDAGSAALTKGVSFISSKGTSFLSNMAHLASSPTHASPSHNVLAAMVTGYEDHLMARSLSRHGWLFPASPEHGPPSTHATWGDIMMWAVLSGNHNLAENVWPRTSRPMLAALQMLLGPDRLFEGGASNTRLRPLMEQSRKEQNEVSSRLA